MNPEEIDPVIDEVRLSRRRISERFANDPAALVAYYIELQKRYTDRLGATKESAQSPDQSAA